MFKTHNRAQESQKDESGLTETTRAAEGLSTEKQSSLAWKSIWSTFAETPTSIQKHQT
jgi:hypothetical protein